MLRSCGELAAELIQRDEEIGRLQAAVRQLTAEQDTLKAAHAHAIAEAVAEQEQRLREEQQREAIERLCQATEAANRAKSEFLANMSHEIRTPLNAILGFTELLLKGADGGNHADRRDFLQTIHTSGQHLMELINDILDLSKIEAGRMETERLPCSPVAIVESVLAVLRVRADEKGLSLRCERADGVPEAVFTDPVRLKQLLMNLLSNAVKFTDSGGVCVLIRPLENSTLPQLAFDVVDSGIGIAAEKLATIFDAFVQADNSVTRSHGGTGLGLAISLRIAEALGGSLTVRSEPGKGSTFTATIEATACPLPLPPANLQEQTPQSTTAEIRPELALAGTRILLVDDGPTNRKLIGLILRRAGADVVLAENGEMAVELAGSQRFDLILMDMQMPVMDGYTATRKIRQSGLGVPIIALTAHAMRGDQGKCLEAGCSGYLPKPISQDLLLAELARVLVPVGERARHEAPPAPAGPPIVSSLPLEDPEICEIVADFVAGLPEQMAVVRGAWAGGDVAELTRLAHRLKGTSGMAGFAELMAAFAQLEDLARQNRDQEVGMALMRAEALCGRAAAPVAAAPV